MNPEKSFSRRALLKKASAVVASTVFTKEAKAAPGQSATGQTDKPLCLEVFDSQTLFPPPFKDEYLNPFSSETRPEPQTRETITLKCLSTVSLESENTSK